MSSIQPFGSELQSVTPWQTMAADRLNPAGSAGATGGTEAAGAAQASSAQSISMQSSVTRVSQVHQEVNAFLGTLGGGLQDNEMLRMMLALLILNALLTQDDGSTSRNQRVGAAALELLGSMGTRQDGMLYQSSYSAVQVDFQQSSYAIGSQSVQPSSGAEGEGSAPRFDVSA